MTKPAKEIQILFVVETNASVKSDSAYIVWMLKKSFGDYIVPGGSDELFAHYDFVFMDGRQNYKKRSVKSEIKSKSALFFKKKTHVVCCVDVDSQTSDDLQAIAEIKRYTKDNGYHLVISYREIEDVIKAPSGSSKHERVKLFLKRYPKKEYVDDRQLSVPFDQVIGQIGATNFNLVVGGIVDDEKTHL